MIYDVISNAHLYKGISPQLDRALDALMSIDAAPAETGRIDFGDGVYANVMDCAQKPLEATKWEAHRRYIDIQRGFEDGESIGCWPIGALSGWDDYDADADITFSPDAREGVVLPLKADRFAVFFPGDAHRPCRAEAEPKVTRKIVFKIPV